MISCANGGICKELQNGFQCQCPEPFTGKLCETGKQIILETKSKRYNIRVSKLFNHIYSYKLLRM